MIYSRTEIVKFSHSFLPIFNYCFAKFTDFVGFSIFPFKPQYPRIFYHTDKKKNYYDILELPKNARPIDIKKSFYRLAKIYHPDSNIKDKNALIKFQEISEAYEVLRDVEKRAEYDKLFEEKNFDFVDKDTTEYSFLGKFHTVEADKVFSRIFANQIYNREEIEKDTNYAASHFGFDRAETIYVTLDLEKAAFGGEYETKFNSIETCQYCRGRGTYMAHIPPKCPFCEEGFEVLPNNKRILCRACLGKKIYIRYPCTQCEGKSKLVVKRTAYFIIPPGVEDGEKYKIDLQGTKGIQTLNMVLSIKPHEYFRKIGMDIHTDTEISLSQATLGGTVKIKGLYEEIINVTIPSGTSSHSVIICKNMGWRKGNKCGHHYVHVKIKVPEKISKRQKLIFGRYAEFENTENGTVNGILTNSSGIKKFVMTEKEDTFFEKLCSIFNK